MLRNNKRVMAEWHLLVVLNWKLARAPDISPWLLKVKSMRSSDHGDLSGNKFLTKGSCPSIVCFIDRTNPNGHWIWALLSMTMGKYPGCIYVEQILNERQ